MKLLIPLLIFSAGLLVAAACVSGEAGERTTAATSTPTLVKPTPTATSASIPLPQQPVIHLRYGGQVYDGVQGNSCWPLEKEISLCQDEGPFPWEVLDTVIPVPVAAGDSIIVEIEADDRPQRLLASIFEETSQHASDAAVQVIELEPNLTASLTIDLPVGVYNIRITGLWAVGDQAYKFKMEVKPTTS